MNTLNLNKYNHVALGGTFDILHIGHLHLLKESFKVGNFVTIGITSDNFVKTRLNKKIKNLTHHTLFFDVDFEKHGREIYTTKEWPSEPLFYVGATSVTDKTVAPEGGENLFFLIPVASGLTEDTEELRNTYFEKIIKRFEKHIGEEIRSHVVYKKTFGPGDFINEYNAFKGNAYGLANTLLQTAILKPSCRSKKVKNLFYTGQLTVPGPGVPPSLISGEVVAREIFKHFDS